MQKAAEEQKFEQALEIRNQIIRIEKLVQKQIVDTQNTKNQDVIAFRKQDETLKIVQFYVKKVCSLANKISKLKFKRMQSKSF